MWIGQTTRSPLTAVQTEYSSSGTGAAATSSVSQTGKTDSNGATSGKTDYFSGTAAFGTTWGGTTDASGGATTSSTNAATSGSGTSAGSYTTYTLTTGVSTSTFTNKPGTVSAALSTIYTYPTSTVATSTETTTKTDSTAASEYTTVYGSTTTTTGASGTYTQTTTQTGFITDTSRISATVQITCSSKFDVIETAFWLNDDERGWSFTGGAGVLPLNSLCSEASGSFTTTVTTSTVARTRPVADWLANVTYSALGVTNSTNAASWTSSTSASTAITRLTISKIPNSTSTLSGAVSPATTTQRTSAMLHGAFGSTETAGALSTETYMLTGIISTTAQSFVPAFNNSGDATGFTTRSAQTYTTSTTSATRGASVAESGTSSYASLGNSFYASWGEGVSETITTQLEWTGLTGDGFGGNSGGVSAFTPIVPRGVRVYDSAQQESIFAQIAAPGLGFTIPFRAFSLFERGSVFSPMDTFYTATDASAGNTRSYTVSVGTSATSDTARFISVTRATVSTTKSTISASFYNTHELTRRQRSDLEIGNDVYALSVVIGGKQFDSRLEIAAFQNGVLDYTIVESTTTHSGVLTGNASYTTSADSSSLIAISRLSGWASEGRAAGYSTTPKWQTVWP